jgi:hypothetical protein
MVVDAGTRAPETALLVHHSLQSLSSPPLCLSPPRSTQRGIRRRDLVLSSAAAILTAGSGRSTDAPASAPIWMLRHSVAEPHSFPAYLFAAGETISYASLLPLWSAEQIAGAEPAGGAGPLFVTGSAALPEGLAPSSGFPVVRLRTHKAGRLAVRSLAAAAQDFCSAAGSDWHVGLDFEDLRVVFCDHPHHVQYIGIGRGPERIAQALEVAADHAQPQWTGAEAFFVTATFGSEGGALAAGKSAFNRVRESALFGAYGIYGIAPASDLHPDEVRVVVHAAWGAAPSVLHTE